MKLYYFPGACSQAPHIVARELGIPLTLERVDTEIQRTETGAVFTDVNPKGLVPVLKLDDGTVYTEAAVILQVLADMKPEAGLLAKWGTAQRYRQMEWLNYTATEVHKLFRPMIKNGPEGAQEYAREQLKEALAFINHQLEGKEYLLGAFTAVDPYMSVVLGWTRVIKFDTTAWPNIATYIKRVRARPAAREALKAEGLLKE